MMNHTETETGLLHSSALELSSILITLLKGVIYQEENPALWSALLNLMAAVRDYVAVLGLELILDESEGYAFLRSHSEGETEGANSTINTTASNLFILSSLSELSISPCNQIAMDTPSGRCHRNCSIYVCAAKAAVAPSPQAVTN